MAHTMFWSQQIRDVAVRRYHRGVVTALVRRLSDHITCVDLYVAGAFVASVSGEFTPSEALRECRIAWEGVEWDE